MENLIKALQIFLKYGNIDYPTHCEHDVLYVCVDPEKVLKEDKEKLEKLSFTPDMEISECFSSFKYGSA